MMGKKDAYQFDYLDDDRRFADQVNGALFQGRQVVRAEDLEPEEAQTVSFWQEAGQKKKSTKTVVDKVRCWKGRKIHILAVENQNYVDYQMVFRNMLSESHGYHKQWKQKRRSHAERKDLQGDPDEFLSGMKRGEKFVPIITLVVYFGTEKKWDGARCLYDLLEIDEELKEYVTNYKLNIYDCQEHDTFEEYQTGLRQVFETVRYGKDKERLREVMEKSKEAYSRIDSDTKEMLEAVANVRIPETFKVEEEGEERYDMCKAWEDQRLEGIEIGREEGRKEGRKEGRAEGIREGIRALVQTCKKFQISKELIVEQCMEGFGLTGEEAMEYVEEYEM